MRILAHTRTQRDLSFARQSGIILNYPSTSNYQDTELILVTEITETFLQLLSLSLQPHFQLHDDDGLCVRLTLTGQVCTGRT